MKAEDAIKTIETAILDVKKQNQSMVSVDALLQYLERLKEDIKNTAVFDQKKLDVDLALLRTGHERNLAHYEAQQQHSLEMLRAVITYGQAAIKSAILINGGAAVALLAFIGNIWAKTTTTQFAIDSLTKAIVFFALGVVTGAIGTGTTYITQYLYSENRQKPAYAFHIVTVLIVLSTYALFCFGVYGAYNAFVLHLAINK